MKRFLFMIIVLSLSVCALFAGGKKAAAANGKPDVVAVNFPAYDFARQIAGDRVNLTMLLPPGAESHSFEPTPRDIIKIQECDVFIYTGGESDVWVDRILDSFDSSKIRAVRMMDAVDVVVEEVVEGMQDDEEHDHEHAELNPADVEDRPLSDFSGNWKTSVPYLKDGSVDTYFEHAAEESGMTPADVKAMYINMMRTDYPALKVTSDSIAINGVSAKATYKGFKLVESDHGVSPWYMYETGGTAGVPKYWVFNDHGHEAGRQEEEIAHIHALYSNTSFDDIFAIENWAAMYFDASATAGDILAAMMHHEEEHEEEHEYDEHVWTFPQNAKRVVRVITDVLCEVDGANAAVFRRNADVYSAQLDELDREFRAVVNGAKRKTIVFGDRFPFRYFADAYGLTYFAAFPGCSTETEPSAATVAFLIDKVKAEKIPVVFHIELSNERMADTIAEETGAKKLLLHACHNISKQEFDRGVTFLELQRANVPRLREALR
ncbi:MAG: zinc ABC transporter substrate-binding protein [Spirochaetaceae bacterium]|jgi:zinc transport system substrate-binding protein|nr:zinc ABC transporter substrate-binding protein [Spirochaetaceae bacterium]